MKHTLTLTLNACRPRVASGAFSPADISGGVGWYDASQISGLANNDPVNTWEDAFDAGNDLAKMDADAPTYKTAQLNGLPAVSGDGVNDKLRGGDLTGVSIGSIFAVVKVDPSALVPAGVGSLGVSGSGKRFMTLYPDVNTIYGEDSGGFFDTNFTNRVDGAVSFVLPSGWHVVSQIATGAPVAAPSSGQVILFFVEVNNAYSKIDLAEVIFYNTALSTENREAVEEYLSTKWGL